MQYWNSIRKFIDKQVGEETLKQLLQSGKEIVDSVGDKVLSFTVIQNKEEIKELNNITKKDMITQDEVPIITRLGKTKDFDIFYGAPAVIMVSVKKKYKGITDLYSECVEKIVEKAKNMGLETHWNSFVKYHPFEKSELELDIPEDYAPYYAISIGYAC